MSCIYSDAPALRGASENNLPTQRVANPLDRLPRHLVADVVDTLGPADLLSLYRAWPAVATQTLRPIAWHGSTVPKTFAPNDLARRWQIEQLQRRARLNVEAGRLCERNLWGFCDSDTEMLAADGGFIQTWFDGQDRLTSFTTRHAPELRHDGPARGEFEQGEQDWQSGAPRSSLQTSSDDRWVAHLGRPGLGYHSAEAATLEDEPRAPERDFAPGFLPHGPMCNADVHTELVAANGLPLTLIDASCYPPASSAVMTMAVDSVFCFSQDARNLLVLHRPGAAHQAYAGGGLLDLHASIDAVYWRPLCTAVTKMTLAAVHPVRQLGRSQFLIVGQNSFTVLAAPSGAALSIPKQSGEELCDAAGWSADGRCSAFATNKQLRIFTQEDKRGIELRAQIDCEQYPPGYIEQIRLFGSKNELFCAIETTDGGLRHWPQNLLSEDVSASWSTVSNGAKIYISIAGCFLHKIQTADHLAPRADFLMIEEGTEPAADEAHKKELVGYKFERGEWRRRLLLSYVGGHGADEIVDLLPHAGLLAFRQAEHQHHIFTWNKDLPPTSLTIPPWLNQPKLLFFSSLTGDLIALFGKPKDDRAAAHMVDFPLSDPDVIAKHGEEYAKEEAGWEQIKAGKVVLAGFRQQNASWTMMWAKWVEDYWLSRVSRDGSVLLLSEHYNHMLLDFCF